MKKYGYHRLCLASGDVIEGPVVVTLDDNMQLTEWHLLLGEEPMVEWVGGQFLLK